MTIINQIALPQINELITPTIAIVGTLIDRTSQPILSVFVWLNNVASTLILFSPTIVAIAAIITLYLAYIKNGKISVGLHTYCICDQPNDLDLELSLGFYNTGATGKTIMGLRIKLQKDDWVSKPLYCEHTMNDIGAGASGNSHEIDRKWIKPFVIDPRRGYTNCFSFSIKKEVEIIELNEGNYKILLEAKFADKKGWQKIDLIDFYIDNENHTCASVHLNDPEFGRHAPIKSNR